MGDQVLLGAIHFPLNTGFSLARNALTPSRKSSVSKQA